MAAPMKTCYKKLQTSAYWIYFTRSYARNMKRDVQKVFTPQDDIKQTRKPSAIVDPRRNAYLPFVPGDPVQKSISEFSKSVHVVAKKTVSQKNEKKKVNPNTKENKVKGIIETTSGGLSFEKLEENDRRLGRLILRAKSRKGREDHGEIVLEGRNLIIDALKAGAKLVSLYFSGSNTMLDFPSEYIGDSPIYKIQYRHMKLWSDVETPQGFIGIFKMPVEGEALCPASHSLPVTLICDAVKDAGNLGTLIRSAAAVGCQQVIATKGCIDIWNSKVLRSAAGCHFRVPIISNLTWPQIPAFLPSTDAMKVYIADSNQQTEEHSNRLAGSMKAVKNIEKLREEELQGSSIECFDVDIPVDENTSEDPEQSSYENEIEEDDSFKNPRYLSAYHNAPLNLKLYDSVDYTEKHAIIVISGETSGVSAQARMLAYDNYGECVTMPMAAEVESLNCAVAGSVILYEVEKQFRHLQQSGDGS